MGRSSRRDRYKRCIYHALCALTAKARRCHRLSTDRSQCPIAHTSIDSTHAEHSNDNEDLPPSDYAHAVDIVSMMVVRDSDYVNSCAGRNHVPMHHAEPFIAYARPCSLATNGELIWQSGSRGGLGARPAPHRRLPLLPTIFDKNLLPNIYSDMRHPSAPIPFRVARRMNE